MNLPGQCCQLWLFNEKKKIYIISKEYYLTCLTDFTMCKKLRLKYSGDYFVYSIFIILVLNKEFCLFLNVYQL